MVIRMIKIKVIAQDPEALPCYMSDGAAGADVKSSNIDPISILPGKVGIIPTGLFFEIPEGYEIQVRPRSGLAVKNSVTVLNTPGTIDSDYRGELKLIMINHGSEPFIVTKGMRMAQIVVGKVHQADFVLSEELTQTVRGQSRFGHTGLN